MGRHWIIMQEPKMIVAFIIFAVTIIFVKYIVPSLGLAISIYRLKRTKNKRWFLVIGVSLIWLVTSIWACIYYAYCV